jgi:hypothetical protein
MTAKKKIVKKGPPKSFIHVQFTAGSLTVTRQVEADTLEEAIEIGRAFGPGDIYAPGFEWIDGNATVTGAFEL